MQVIVILLHKYSFLAVFRPVCVCNVRYIRKLSDLSVFYCLNVQLYHLCGKSRFVCAHIGQNRHIYPPSIFRLHFWLVPLPLLRRLTVGAAIEKNFFYFSDFVLEFYFFQNPNFNSLSFARYSSSDFSLCIISYWFSLWILIFSFTLRFMASIIIMDSMFFDSIFRLVFTRWIFLASISTYFSIVDSML